MDGETMNRTDFKISPLFSKMVELNLEKYGSIYYQNFDSYKYRKYTKADIMKYLKDPVAYGAQLRDASIYLYAVSTHYRRIINYFANICPIDYVIYPFKFDEENVDEKKFTSCYKKAKDYLEIMNLQHETRKMLTTAWREDLFAGYIYQEKDSMHIRKLPPDYIKITGIIDGCYMVSFDFSYFDAYWIKENGKRVNTELENWGSEFIEKYALYEKDKTHYRWQALDDKRQFNIKISEDVPYILVPFLGCFPGIYDIEDYKDLAKGAAVLKNYKALGILLPTDEKGNLLTNKGMADEFYANIDNVTPPNVGVFETPYEIKAYDFERSGAEDTDKVYEAVKNFYDSVGISALIFGGDKQTAASLNISITADATLCYAVNRQIERNVNRLLKTALSGKYKFQIKILDVSEFNKQQVHDMYLKDAQYGMPTKQAAAATLGITQPAFSALLYFENDYLNLHDEMVPLQSSHTQSSSDEVGRPTAEEEGKEISDSNENTREHDSNASR